jgi:hypothetical protein
MAGTGKGKAKQASRSWYGSSKAGRIAAIKVSINAIDKPAILSHAEQVEETRLFISEIVINLF